MLDSFDHGGSEEPGDERSSLLGEDSGGLLERNGEEEEEFQVRTYSDECVVSKGSSAECTLQHGSSMSSRSVQLVTACPATALGAEGHMGTNDWRCDYPGCGRRFHKRHDLNRHKKYHYKPFKCPKPSCAANNLAFALAKDLLRHQRSHSDKRYFCHHAGCSTAVGGKFTGFAREDNWRRHLKNQHIESLGVSLDPECFSS